MTDARLVQIVSLDAVTIDLLMTPAGSLDTTQELATAAIIALGTDALAYPDDVLPDQDDDDRRGWWGDLDAARLHDGWPIGTRLWLLERQKITGSEARQGSTLGRAESYVREALEPLIARRIATRVEITARRAALDVIEVEAMIYRGPLPAIELRFANLWDGIRT